MEIVNIVVVGVLVSWIVFAGGGEVIGLPQCDFPAIYNFGDSNSDTGGIFAAFFPVGSPNGETFFHKPAGRASDGRLIIDFIADKLRLPYLSAYLDSIEATFQHGANFATGGSTIRRQNETFFDGVSPFSLDVQTAQFDQFKARTSHFYHQGKKECNKTNLPRPQDFSKALYTFDIGQNDLAAGFKKMNEKQLRAAIPDIIDHLAIATENIYQQGGRFFWIHNTGPIGCLPVTLHGIRNPPPSGLLDENGCVKGQNDMAKEFNRQLKRRVIKLRTQHQDAAITYVDIYAAKYKLISNARNQGFVEPSKICCGYHKPGIHVWCGQKANINGTEVYAGSCKDPSVHISWDGVHYSEAANQWIANHIVEGSFSEPPVPITHACQKV